MTAPSTENPTGIRSRIATALRQNLVPGLILQAFALVLVLAYYNIEPVTEACVKLGDFKIKWGFAFSAVSTGLFGGALPFAILLMMKRVPRKMILAVGAYFLIYWSWKGVEVDCLYRVQAMLFGNGTEVSTILKKVAVDQFGYNLFYSIPTMAVLNLWKDHDFSFAQCRASLTRAFFMETFPTMLLSTWMIWLPTTAIVYSMPTPLQVPLFNIVLCFYVLLVTVIGEQAKK